jgi:hypothetical protein
MPGRTDNACRGMGSMVRLRRGAFLLGIACLGVHGCAHGGGRQKPSATAGPAAAALLDYLGTAPLKLERAAVLVNGHRPSRTFLRSLGRPDLTFCPTVGSSARKHGSSRLRSQRGAKNGQLSASPTSRTMHERTASRSPTSLANTASPARPTSGGSPPGSVTISSPSDEEIARNVEGQASDVKGGSLRRTAGAEIFRRKGPSSALR